MNHRQYLRQMKKNSKLNNGGFKKWLEILTGEYLLTKLSKSEKVNLKFTTSNGTAKATLSTRFTVAESPPISQANEKEQQTQQRWIQQVAGNPRRGIFTDETPQEREGQLEIQHKQWHSEGNVVKKRQRLQQPQICTEEALKYYNYTANETDEEREHRLPLFQQNAVNRIGNETDEERQR